MMKCPECDSAAVVRIGFIVTREGKKQRHKCNKCGRTFYGQNLERGQSGQDSKRGGSDGK